MALPRRPVIDRPRRRSRLPRLLVTGLLLTGLVLAVNSVVRSSAEGPDPVLAYLDTARPLIDDSTRQGAAVEDLRDRAGELGRTGLRRTLDSLQRDSDATASAIRALEPPAEATDAAGLLITSVVTRAQAVGRMRDALSGALGERPVEEVADALTAIGRDFTVADRAYQLFLDGLSPERRRVMPPSVWVADDVRWSRTEVVAFVSTLRASATLAPVHDVAVVTVTTEPAAVGSDGPAKVLPNVKSIVLQVVVANVGNEAERRVPVDVVARSDAGIKTARNFVDLAAGQRLTTTLTVSPPVGGGPVTMTVKVGPVAGEGSAADNEQTQLFVLR
jgi:hypothetical protein